MPRGRPPAYTREQVLAAAITVADTEGLEAVTMRRIATEIGAGAMSLYTYVPDREHLIDLMVDRVAGEPVPPAVTGDWRADSLALVAMQRDLMLAHPWLPRVLAGRRITGRNLLGFLEHGLRALEPAGLPGITKMTLLGLFTGFVASYVTGELAGAASSVEEIGAAVASGDFPQLARVLSEGGGAPPDFRMIADWMIAGLVEQARGR
ncbi:TetR/AcrR family transcriptional regulator [Actinoplanes regularis]|uniref:Transcriptional regulator, TetR family n=1 Tax=Actinoplanes regularis TaxID=52697 RepID=A0A238UQ10_9ACTN|nr:TetR/AcrR family transcriptional regulator [Actinoplanes regularis]GIE84559.1 TetR family transcriptional regulator [Actinoplanes regularis]SNR24205.1 transcriptional regulator, TetR family [Actinoplanes regularis]